MIVATEIPGVELVCKAREKAWLGRWLKQASKQARERTWRAFLECNVGFVSLFIVSFAFCVCVGVLV